MRLHVFSLFLPTALLVLLHFPPLNVALGINCRGSLKCTVALFLPPRSTPLGAMLGSCAAEIDLHRPYLRGEHIACVKAVDGGGICLFMQGNVPFEGILGYKLCDPLRELVKHGCRVCGSVPLSGDNVPEEMGEMTANFVVSPSCVGWCRSVVRVGNVVKVGAVE